MAAQVLAPLLAARAATLAYYSPYFCLAQALPGLPHALFGEQRGRIFGQQDSEEILSSGPESSAVQWLMERLSWDSAYFGTPVYRLFTGLFGPDVTNEELRVAARALQDKLAERGSFYAYGLAPAQDVRLLQALTGAGWRLVETRLTYYRDNLTALDWPRFSVRTAQLHDKERVAVIASANPNPYDRFHADPWFGPARADAFLARYAAAAVAGTMADAVLLPAEPGLPIDSFLAISDLQADAALLGVRLSRIMLTAVGPLNRGWHVKLVAETLHRARAHGHSAVLMTTQATNTAVCRTAEKLGFKLGSVSHVLSCWA